MQNMPIGIFRGDDTDAFSYQTIVGTVYTDLDLTGCKAVFRYLGFSMEFDPIPEDRKLTIVIPADETKKFPPGLGYASLRVYDSEGRLKTFSNRIMVFVATKTPMFGSDEFEVDFNVRATLEPLKFFVGPNPDDFDEYRGYLEKVIDRASAAKYGLAILLDAIDSNLGAANGVAATPVAVKAAYAAIIKKLTDDYYTAEQTDEAIDRVAAYYITYDAAGNPFPTYAALANAHTVYSGGKVRTPTRNDYCVVLADETHQGAEYRYIYAVAEGQTTGSWQPQFPVEGVMTVDPTVTRNSQNPVSGGGVWSAIWGALAALPTGFTSLYDWCVAQLAGKVPTSRTVNGKALSSDVTLTGADIPVDATQGAQKIDAALAGKQSALSAQQLANIAAVPNKLDSVISKTHSELLALRDNDGLKPGQQYRITDYVATTNGDMESQSANHPFDIIVTADDERTLNEHARAVIHEGDLPDDIVDGSTRTKYFAGCDLAAWDIWYCLDNDTTRFAWADATNGKGVVYRLVDEFQNDCPYDFKGIQFKAYGDTDNIWRYTFDSGDASDNTDLSKSGLESYVYKNTIGQYDEEGQWRLNRIVFKGSDCYSNTFGSYCHYNTFGSYCYCNTFGSACDSNTFGSDCNSNTFGSSCYYNTFGSDCYCNTFGPACDSNTFGSDCYCNTFGSACHSNTFGSYYNQIELEDAVSFVALDCTADRGDGVYYQNVTVSKGVGGTSDAPKVIEDPNVNQSFKTTYQPADSQVISV